MKVRVLQGTLGYEGKSYEKGETVDLPEDIVKGLRVYPPCKPAHVELVEPAPEKKKGRPRKDIGGEEPSSTAPLNSLE